MRPKETAKRLMDIVQDARSSESQYNSSVALKIASERLLRLASELIALEPGYGHAAKLHQLTERAPKRPITSFATVETATRLAADFIAGKPGMVADELATMDTRDAVAVALSLAPHLTHAKRALLVDMILGG